MEHSPGFVNMLGHKVTLGTFKEIEIMSSIFSNYNTMRLEINYKKWEKKAHKHMEVKFNMLLNNQWINRRNQKNTKGK